MAVIHETNQEAFDRGMTDAGGYGMRDMFDRMGRQNAIDNLRHYGDKSRPAWIRAYWLGVRRGLSQASH